MVTQTLLYMICLLILMMMMMIVMIACLFDRSVDQRDKSLAMGLVGTILAVFAFIPYPLIFGHIIDATCLVWESTCGQTGNCWLYDMDRFRVFFHSTAVGFLLVGISLEVGAVAMAGRVRNLYDDDDVCDADEGDGKEDKRSTSAPAAEDADGDKRKVNGGFIADDPSTRIKLKNVTRVEYFIGDDGHSHIRRQH